ncbi:hypothetical protein VM1G_07360 [Cytospora mali]|uniref:Rhodopsin domain-containing protein n=1 Tax=Cytospora mali TaxID=578113 RepID=A0A194W695_CYTMA|nr:hypothetical protein VM1G_07360 [Valsa mali]
MSDSSSSILDGPSVAAPAGQTSDFDHPGGSHQLGYFAIIFCGVVATLATLSRLCSRLVMKPRVFGFEEGFLVCALGLFAGFNCMCYKIAIYPGFLVHQWNVRLRDIENFSYRLHLASNFYGLTLLFVKLAILVDWSHLFNPRKLRNSMFWTIRVLLVVNTVYYLAAFFLETFRCTPRQKMWDPLYRGGHCPIHADVLNIVSSVLNLASDVIILALPQWIIWRLNLTKAKKAGVSVLFVIGIFATVCGIARMVYSVQTLSSSDYTYVYTAVGLWSLGELTSGFLVIGVPALPKLYRSLYSEPGSFLRRVLGRHTANSGGGHHIGSSDLPPWRRTSPSSRAPRDPWDVYDNDHYDLLSVQPGQATHMEAGQDPSYSVELPKYAVLREDQMDVISQSKV